MMWIVLAGVALGVIALVAWRRGHRNSGAAGARDASPPNHRAHGDANAMGTQHQGNFFNGGGL